MIRPYFPALSLALASLTAQAGTLLETSVGPQAQLATLAGKASGVTVTGPNTTGGACLYNGRGAYVLDDAGRLTFRAEQNCAGLTNLFTLPVCSLSVELNCSPTGRFAHHYQVVRAGLTVDAQLVAWLPTQAPSVPDLLVALKARIAAAEALARAEWPTPTANPKGLVIRCHAPRSSFMIRGHLSALMLYQQRPDPDAICADKVLEQVLTTAHLGEGIDRSSPLGRCFELSGKVTDWSSTSCTVATH